MKDWWETCLSLREGLERERKRKRKRKRERERERERKRERERERENKSVKIENKGECNGSGEWVSEWMRVKWVKCLCEINSQNLSAYVCVCVCERMRGVFITGKLEEKN